ncbi:hypothetical protein TNCV_1054341 [Trichonephila clavipes]|nr:hypothetical protein TNCV_1054341 [Trichonephila clavipes]
MHVVHHLFSKIRKLVPMLRDDSLHGTLQPPYSGPYCLLQRIGKVFVLRIGTKEARVSVDRIKSASRLVQGHQMWGKTNPHTYSQYTTKSNKHG